jgi:uncharacterized protein YdeI (YjbR/CyaY-like superfamily)
MSLPDMHPYAGRAMTLTRAAKAMTDDTEEAMMGSRLAETQDRIQELEAEVERLELYLHDIWKIADQSHTGMRHRIRRIKRNVPDDLQRYDALDSAEGCTDE